MALATDSGARRARNLKFGTNVIAATVLFLVVLVAANYLAGHSRWRLDLTNGKQFTITPSTDDILHQLKDIVNVTVYATEENTPPDWTEQRNQLKNLLNEYRIRSKGRVKYSFKDPGSDPKLEREAQQAGIREQAMQQASETELSVKAGYLGLTVQYQGKSETIPVVSPQSPLEYQLTRAINKVAQVSIPTIGLLAPQGNPYMGDQGNFALISQLLQQEGYTVKNLDEHKLGDLKDVNMLMIFQPEDYSEETLYRIDQYVMNGGKVFVAATGVQIDMRQQRGTPKSPNINSLLENYGLRVNQDLLEDWGGGLTQQFLTQRGIVASTNPFISLVTDLSSSSPLTRKIPQMIFIYPSSVSKSEHGTSGTMEILAKTSNKTKKQEQFFILDQQKVKRPPKSEALDSYTLMASVKGPLDSRFAVVDPPAITKDDGTTEAVKSSDVKRVSAPDAQVIVAGDIMSFYDEVIGNKDGQANRVFLLNVADTLTRGGQMIALRSKQSDIATLRDSITPSEALFAQAVAICAIPVLLIFFGIIKLYLNRMKRARYREVYGGGEA